MRKQEDRCPVPATNRGPKPADFPLGSLESRAAARIMAKTRAEQDAEKPLLYLAHFDEPPVIYDYVTGLPVSEAKADKPTPPEPSTTCPGESEPGDSEIVVEILPAAGQEHSVASPRSAATVGLERPGPLPAPGEAIDELVEKPPDNADILHVEIEE